MQNFIELLKDALVIWFERGCESMAAAVSYYAMFALVPLIFVSVYVVSLIFGEELVTKVMLSWGSGMGTGVITLLQNAVAELPNSPLVSLAPIGTLFFLLAAVVIFFNTLTEGFHHLFGVSPSGVRGLLRKSGRALVVVVVLQLFIMGLIAAEFGFALFFEGLAIRSYATTGVYIGALFILFTLCYSILPLDNVPSIQSRLYGAGIAALLFSIAKTTVSVHIAMTPVPDLFGAAGVAVALLLWVYVSASVVYYGAAFAHVHDLRRIKKEGEDAVLP